MDQFSSKTLILNGHHDNSVGRALDFGNLFYTIIFSYHFYFLRKFAFNIIPNVYANDESFLKFSLLNESFKM